MSRKIPEWHQLRKALAAGDYAIATRLLKKNAKLLTERNGIGETVLHYLAVEDYREAVAWLHSRGADLNTVNDYGTPVLFEVAQLGYRQLLLWMLELGADPNAKDAYGQGIGEYLIEYKKREIAEYVKQCVESFSRAQIPLGNARPRNFASRPLRGKRFRPHSTRVFDPNPASEPPDEWVTATSD